MSRCPNEAEQEMDVVGTMRGRLFEIKPKSITQTEKKIYWFVRNRLLV